MNRAVATWKPDKAPSGWTRLDARYVLRDGQSFTADSYVKHRRNGTEYALFIAGDSCCGDQSREVTFGLVWVADGIPLYLEVTACC